MTSPEPLVESLVEVALPLMLVDHAELYVVASSPSDVHLHLAGAYSGCAGVEFVHRHLLAPLVASVFPKATLKITTGFPVPKGARLLEATSAA